MQGSDRQQCAESTEREKRHLSVRRRKHADGNEADDEGDHRRRGNSGCGRLRRKEAIGRQEPGDAGNRQPDAPLLEHQHRRGGKDDAERGIKAELVLGGESADETVGAVKRIKAVDAEQQRIEQNDGDADKRATRQRPDRDHPHRDQRADDMRHILDGGAHGHRRSFRPEAGQNRQNAEGENPQITRIVAEHAPVIDHHQRQPHAIIGQNRDLPETRRIGENEE
ncbi:hypothetical protein D3C72_567220 [compost metagenome]